MKRGLNEGELFFRYVNHYRDLMEIKDNSLYKSQDEYDNQKKMLAESQQSEKRLRAHIDAIEEKLYAMENSTSWKATAWLRKLVNLFRK